MYCSVVVKEEKKRLLWEPSHLGISAKIPSPYHWFVSYLTRKNVSLLLYWQKKLGTASSRVTEYIFRDRCWHNFRSIAAQIFSATVIWDQNGKNKMTRVNWKQQKEHEILSENTTFNYYFFFFNDWKSKYNLSWRGQFSQMYYLSHRVLNVYFCTALNTCFCAQKLLETDSLICWF